MNLYIDKKTGECVPVDNDSTESKLLNRRSIVSRRFELQAQASSLLADYEEDGSVKKHHRVSCCSRFLGHNKGSAQIRERNGRASYGNLMFCGNVWACPVCAPKVAERRSSEVQEAIAWAKSNDLHISMLTLTTPHTFLDSCKDLVQLVTKSWSSVTGHYSYNSTGGPRSSPGIKHTLGVEGYIKAFEVTHGRNGWHPHFHIIFFTSNPFRDHHARSIFKLWRKKIKSMGHKPPTYKHGYKLNDGTKAGDYITKFGDDGEILKTRSGKEITWDISDEVTKCNSKKGRRDNRKPFQILSDSKDGCKKSSELFREYVKAFKGRSQLQWSDGFKGKVGLTDKSDEEIAVDKGESTLMFSIPRMLWRLFIECVNKRKAKRSVLLHLAEEGGLLAVCTYLSRLLSIDYDFCFKACERETAIEHSLEASIDEKPLSLDFDFEYEHWADSVLASF